MLEFFIQFVEHNITQQWTKWTSLRSTLLVHFEHSMVHHTTTKIFVYKTDYSAVFYRTAEYFYEFAMTYGIKFHLTMNTLALGYVIPAIRAY